METKAQLAIQSVNKLDHSEILSLKSGIKDRFILLPFQSKNFIHEIDEQTYTNLKLEKYAYQIDLDCSYYSEFLPKGDGLTISSLMIYLIRLGYSVYYGSENSYCKYKELDAIRLFNYYPKYGNEESLIFNDVSLSEETRKEGAKAFIARFDGNMYMFNLPCLTEINK